LPQPARLDPNADDEPSSVTIVVVNLDGADLLPPCLDSIRALDYTGEYDVVVVDNGSTDGSLELLSDRYPEVTVLPQGRNTGFASAVNQGARAGTGTYLALLNNDMRVDPSWLTELVGGVDRASRTVCVAGLITSDDGSTVDFADASLSFNGRGDQPGFGSPIGDLDDGADGRELLFACGGSLLVDRQVFLDVGGFDETFFAYLEDVDLGWRLNLFGYRVVLAASARSFHLHHGTAGRFPRYQRELLIERNALATVIKNYDDAHLAQVLVPSLLLLAKRGALKAGLDRSTFDIGGSTDEDQVVGRDALATLVAAADITDDLPALFERRRVVQAGRQCPDEDLIARFGHPLRPPSLDAGYLGGQIGAVRAFGLDDVFLRQRAGRALVLVEGGDEALAEVAAVAGRLAPTSVTVAADASTVLWRSADVVIGRADDLARATAIGRWPVVVVVADGEPPAHPPTRVDAVLLLDDGARPEWQRVLGPAVDGANRVLLLDGSGPDALRPVLNAPWKWREARRRGAWQEAATEDVNLLLEARLTERLDVEHRLAAEQHAHWLDVQVVAGVHEALERRRNEVEDLRARLAAADAEISALSRRLAMVRHPVRTLGHLAARGRRSLSP